MSVSMKFLFFWVVTPCRLVRTFRRNLMSRSSALKMDRVCFPETLVSAYASTWRLNPEIQNRQSNVPSILSKFRNQGTTVRNENLHSPVNYEQVKYAECLLPCNWKSFVFPSHLLYKLKIKIHRRNYAFFLFHWCESVSVTSRKDHTFRMCENRNWWEYFT
jgi:hypothetical protein